MIRRLAVLAWVACAPALAAAQLSVTESNDTDGYINIGECSNAPVDTLAFQWTTSSGGPFDLYVSDTAGCPQKTTVNGVTSTANTALVQGGITTTSRNVGDTAAVLLGKVSIACLSTSTSLFACVFPTGNTTTPLVQTSISLDLVKAPPPIIQDVSSGDSSLRVSWTVGSGTADAGTQGSANSFRVYYAPADGSAAERYSTFTGPGTTSGRVSGLTNGVVYNVRMTALTIGGNESDFSATSTGSPTPVNDFWRLYQNDGGKEQGGCATGAAGLAALAALAPLAWRKRRSRP